MRIARKALLVALMAVHLPSAAALSTVPRVAARAADGPPLWVSAREALSPGGALRGELFWADQARRIEENRAANDGGCRRYLGSHAYESRTEPPALDTLIARSYTIVAGRITDADTGFYNGTPGTLYRLEITARAKALGHDLQGPATWLFIPRAQIKTDRGWICSEQITRNVDPVVGQQIVAFAERPAADRDRRILVSTGRGRIVVKNDQGLAGLSWLPRDTDFASFVERIRQSEQIRVEPRGRRQ